MFNRILVPLDGSALAECVLPHAVAFAQVTGAEVTLLRVVEQNTTPDQVESIDPVSWHLRRVEVENYLEDIARRLQAVNPSMPVERVLLEGQAAERIVEFAHDHPLDLIILSSHGSSGLSGWNVSSVVQKIILRAYTSILIIRAYQPQVAQLADLCYQRILVPLDGSARAEYVLPMVNLLSQKCQADFISLAHVVARPEVPRRGPLTPEENELVNHLVERNYGEATAYLDQLKARLPGEVHARVEVSDSVITTLQNLIEEEQADLVLLSAHGYSGRQKYPYGSVGISFIAYGTTPLLIMQDLPQDTLERHPAEIVAGHSGNGGRKPVYDKPSL
jgi:nucleotide-binding universal stress UspA family protein